jgi:hypothetical protein
MGILQFLCYGRINEEVFFESPQISYKLLPPAARGALFEKTAPLDPPQKLFEVTIEPKFNK